MAKRGRPTKGNYSVRTFRISQNVFDTLSKLSEDLGQTKTGVLELAIVKFAVDYYNPNNPINKLKDV